MEYLGLFLLSTVIGTAIMFFACYITGVRISPVWLLIANGAASLAGLIPTIGFILSWIVLQFLLSKYSNAKVWPDLVFMVVISRLITVFISFGLV
jgi:hypothetical protein